MDQLWLPTSTLLHRWLTMLKDDATVNKKALEDLLNRDSSHEMEVLHLHRLHKQPIEEELAAAPSLTEVQDGIRKMKNICWP